MKFQNYRNYLKKFIRIAAPPAAGLALLDAALKQGGDAPLDLLRLAVFGI